MPMSSKAFVLLVAYTMGRLIDRECHGARKEKKEKVNKKEKKTKEEKKTPVCMHACTLIG